MPTQKCVDNVNNAVPPGNVWCGDDLCAQIAQTVDGHCNANGYRPDDPWLLYAEGRWCSCCCTCYGYDTPIEVKPGIFQFVQTINSGDTILAAGLALNWQPAMVSSASGMHTDGPSYPILNVVYHYDNDLRLLQVTDDTLFLMTSGKLKSASALVPGDGLKRADGGEAEVAGPVTNALAVGVHSIELGPFDGVNLDGHLMNSHGVVTADFSVQRVYGAGGFNNEQLVIKEAFAAEALEAGTEEYLTKFPPDKEFLAAVEAAGIHLNPLALAPPRPLITIPQSARGLFRPAQARDIREGAPKFSSTNTFRINMAEKLISMARSSSENVTMLIDWDNNMPNAHAWTQLRQSFIVLTGGLLRIKLLTEAGLSLALSQMLAHHAGIKCVGEAAYTAVNAGMRQIWLPGLFPTMCERAVAEMTEVFKFVDSKDAQEDPRNLCERPSLDCILKSYFAAMGMQPLPECAGPRTIEEDGGKEPHCGK